MKIKLLVFLFLCLTSLSYGGMAYNDNIDSQNPTFPNLTVQTLITGLNATLTGNVEISSVVVTGTVGNTLTNMGRIWSAKDIITPSTLKSAYGVFSSSVEVSGLLNNIGSTASDWQAQIVNNSATNPQGLLIKTVNSSVGKTFGVYQGVGGSGGQYKLSVENTGIVTVSTLTASGYIQPATKTSAQLKTYTPSVVGEIWGISDVVNAIAKSTGTTVNGFVEFIGVTPTY